MDTFYFNVLFLVSVLGILGITLSVIGMIALSLKKKKHYVYDVLDKNVAFDPYTGTATEKKRSMRHIVDIKKVGPPVDTIIGKTVNVQVKTTSEPTGSLVEHQHDTRTVIRDYKGNVKNILETNEQDDILTTPTGPIVHQHTDPAAPSDNPVQLLKVGNQIYMQVLDPMTHSLKYVPVDVPTAIPVNTN